MRSSSRSQIRAKIWLVPLTTKMKVKNIEISIGKIQLLCQKYHIHKLALFGSVLRDDFNHNSDIDILVEFNPEHIPGFIKLHQIQEGISQLFGGRKIDLVTQKFLNYQIKDKILAEMEVYYVAKR
ncbi:putative nucleotidyltransferase [Xenococcus sp. PCC 7305]|nr:nucleotidyltransferase domain-containing protein [Xenococcus sp. PCC 7305]ELS04640.1 putative nucleotidyltransferase [Xenococcus sp. PCC 7305]